MLVTLKWTGCSHIFQRLLVNGFVIHIPRNALGVTQGCIVYLGLMKMYYLKLGNFKGKLECTRQS